MKYLEDPFKKVSYSFRIEEALLEDLKLYSKATGKKLPETFNDLLKESIEGVTVDNTYLKGYPNNTLITIPNIIDMDKDLQSKGLYTLIDEAINVLDPDLEGFIYEVKQIPNNLDVWDNRKPILDVSSPNLNKHNGRGYKSRHYPELIHEGIEFVLIPDMIKPYQIKDCIQPQDITLYKCLVPIYFTVSLDNSFTIEVISMKEALSKIKETNNFELLDEITSLNMRVKEIIDSIILNLDYQGEGQETFYFKGSTYSDRASFLSDVTYTLQTMLLDQVGTNPNVLSSFEAGISRVQEMEETAKDIEEPKSKGIVTKDSLIQGLLQQINTLTQDNKRLEEDKESIKKELEDIRERLDSIEETQENNLNILGGKD